MPFQARGTMLMMDERAYGLGGQQIPFTTAQLTALYPTHDDYVSKYTAAADKAVAARIG